MQLTIDDLRKANDPLALLVGADDEALDQVSALIQGWKDIDIDECPPHGAWVKSNKGGVRKEEWQPSRKLDQAYELLDSGDRRNRYVWACDIDGDGRYVELISQKLGVVQVYFEQAGSHARAVCVLAILGLLQGKDGAA